MAQDLTIAGATYENVPSVEIPKSGGGTASFVDTTDADAVASEIDSGKTAYVNGVKLTGTRSGGGGSYTAGDGIDITSDVISLETASADDIGGIKVGSGLSIEDGVLSVDGIKIDTLYWNSNGTSGVGTTINLDYSWKNYDILVYNSSTSAEKPSSSSPNIKSRFILVREIIENQGWGFGHDVSSRYFSLKFETDTTAKFTYSNGTELLLGIKGIKLCASGGGSYILPIASASTLGGIKVGNNLSIDANGVLSATGGGGGGSFTQTLIYSGNWTSGQITLSESMLNFDDLVLILNNGTRNDLAWAVTDIMMVDIVKDSTSSSPVTYYGEGSRKFSMYYVSDTKLGLESRDTYGVKRIYGRKY